MNYLSKIQKETKKLENLESNSWVKSDSEVYSQKTTEGANQSHSAKCWRQGIWGSKEGAETGSSQLEERRSQIPTSNVKYK